MLHHRRTRAGRVGVLGLATLALAACGTTVAPGQAGLSGLVGPDGGAPLPATQVAQDPLAPGAPAPDATEAVPQGGRATAGPAAVAPGRTPRRTAGGGVGGVAAVAPGVTATTIDLGVVVLKDGEKFANGLGFSISFGDAEREYLAVIRDINARGGVHGRTLRPFVAYYDLGGAAIDAEALQASICAQFTQDRKVFAVLMPYNPLPSFVSCLAKARTLLLNGSAQSTDDTAMAAASGWLHQPSLPSYDGYARSLVGHLARIGFLRSRDQTPAKAGILVLDSPPLVRAAERSLKPAVVSAGLPVAVVTRISPSNSTSDINGAVLRFRADGITHVFFVQAAGGVPLYFMQGAEQQRYYPRYALSSFEVPGFFLQGQVPEAQLANSAGIGWAPFFDVKASELAPTPAEKRCFEAIRKGPQGDGGGEANAHRQSNLTATPVCDLVWTVAAGAQQAGRALTHDAWRAGLRALGTSVPSPVALRTDFSPGTASAVSGYRPLGWVGECRCFRYTGPLVKELR